MSQPQNGEDAGQAMGEMDLGPANIATLEVGRRWAW